MTLFDGITAVKRKDVILKALPPVPKTGWRPPSEFPNLSSAVAIGVDTETYDPELTTAGPGWARKRGHIVGVSLAAFDRLGNTGKWYFPVRHEIEPENNLDARNVFGFCKEVLENTVPKIGANLLYDAGWLTEENIWLNGPLHDIQFAEALIDNNALVGLDVLAEKYLGEHKTSDLLKEWIVAAYKPKLREWRGNIYRSPPSLVGPYAEDDALLPLRILAAQQPLLEAEGLMHGYRLECDLLPLLIEMRRAGVCVDVEAAERLKFELEGEIRDEYDAIYKTYNFALESTDSRQIGKLLDTLGVTYPRNKPSKTVPEGTPSIEKEWLDALDHPIGKQIHDLREREKIVGTFLQSYILDKNINGFLYPQFHPTKSEDGGTKLYRFASSDPNLQNIPSRTELGKKVRRAFIKQLGCHSWVKLDYSQIHYRLLAHNAVGPGSDELRQSYIDDPSMDYHMRVYNDAAPMLGWSTTDPDVIKVKRRPIKNVNFGLLYGQGDKSLAYKAGFSGSQAKEFLRIYHTAAPYVKPTMEAIAAEAERNGFVETLLGRRIRFNLWEPRGYNSQKARPLPYELAVKHYGTFIQLAFLYRAVNYKFQGSEPDIMKTGMLHCWNSGVFSVTGVPRLTVHDELDFNKRDNSPETQEAFKFIQHTMEQAIPLRVPVKVDVSEGDNWGDAD